MKKTILLFSILLVAILGCNLTRTIAPAESPAPIFTDTPLSIIETPVSPPTAFMETLVPTQPAFEGVQVGVDPLRLVISQELAQGARGEKFPRAEGPDVAPWDITPGHITLRLEGYLLQDRAHLPQIYVYPAQEYAELFPGAFESIRRLDNILYGPAAPINAEQLPAVPFFNAAQIFASNIQLVAFQNGQGVRFLTQYAQSAAPVNNRDLFYQFQGLTRDGAYYIIAIFPITHPLLAADGDFEAVLPAGGIPFPDLDDPNADIFGYYTAVTAMLNAASQEMFFPTFDQLDRLVQSMQIIP